MLGRFHISADKFPSRSPLCLSSVPRLSIAPTFTKPGIRNITFAPDSRDQLGSPGWSSASVVICRGICPAEGRFLSSSAGALLLPRHHSRFRPASAMRTLTARSHVSCSPSVGPHTLIPGSPFTRFISRPRPKCPVEKLLRGRSRVHFASRSSFSPLCSSIGLPFADA